MPRESEVIDTTTTDRRGNYRFRRFEETGRYQIRIAGTDQVLDALVSTGEQRLSGLDFELA